MNNMHSDPLRIEKHLLSLFECGCYISTHDIVLLGSHFDLELAFKKRASLLQTLLVTAREKNTTTQLLSLLCTLLESKAEEIKSLLSAYPYATSYMKPQLHKIDATKMLLSREFALHVKESNYDA
jgi:hypothetical protein